MQEQKENNALNISVKSVAKYALLPGLLPMLRNVVGHFSQFLFMFTQIFGSVGLIDRSHPCLRPENVGRYRFTDIIGLAASNVVFDKKHLPQTVMFFAVVISLALTVCMGMALLAATVVNVNQAQAQLFGAPDPASTGGIAYNQSKDWALMFLYRIFGAGSLFPTASGGNPWFTGLLKGMLETYSLAMLVIAAFMIMYLLVITFVESARTGQPFGTRFDSAWTPIRLALAVGLLLPISNSYNGAQLLTFQSAIWGSNLATNTWYSGLNLATANSESYLTNSMVDPGYRFVRDMFLVNLCVQGMEEMLKKPSRFIGTSNLVSDTITYDFGTKEAPDFCGQVTYLKSYEAVSSHNVRPPGLTGKMITEQMSDDYIQVMRDFLPVPDPQIIKGTGLRLNPLCHDDMCENGNANVGEVNAGGVNSMGSFVKDMSAGIMKNANDRKRVFTNVAKNKPGPELVQAWINTYRKDLAYAPIKNAQGVKIGGNFFADTDHKLMIENYNKWMIAGLKNDAQYGWTTAGVFYLRLSTAISEVSRVGGAQPTVSKLPSNLSKSFATPDNPTANTEEIKEFCNGTWQIIKSMAGMNAYCASFAYSIQTHDFLDGGKNWFLAAPKKDGVIYGDLGADQFDRALELGEAETATNLNAGMIMRPIINALSDLTKISSTDMNPLGAIITWGNTLMGVALVAYVIGLAGLGIGVTSLAFMLGNILLLVGFVLAFWVPMIPFLYFMFAVIEWMISILEAVIGMPLFALSLITLEGEGLGGGMKGVKKLFEIVLRPTIIVMSLLVSILIFGAAISFLNSAMALFNTASTANSGMFSSALSGFGMIFVYMFSVYTLATSSFKMINAIPNEFGRWAGLEPGFGSKIKVGLEGVGALGGAVTAIGAKTGLSAVADAGKGFTDKRIENRRAAKNKANNEGKDSSK